MNKAIALFLLMGLFVGGCAKRASLFTADQAMETFNPATLDYTYLSAKGRFVIEEPNGKTTRGAITIRAEKDEKLWFSLTPGLGVEALRGLIDGDRIFIRDRLNGENIAMSFEEFADRYGLRLSLELFQNILFANIPYPFSFEDRLIRLSKTFELTQVRDKVRYHTRVNTLHGKAEEISTTSLENKGSLLVSYKRIEELEGQPFPGEMLLKLSLRLDGQRQNSIFHLDITKVTLETEPLSFPFQY
ncbi:MAG: DUF4292 domain-containing protein [Nitritalea sp.]